MTFADIKDGKYDRLKHIFLVESPSGIQVLMCADDIRHGNFEANFSTSKIIGEGMEYGHARAWADAHPLSDEMRKKLEVEICYKEKPKQSS